MIIGNIYAKYILSEVLEADAASIRVEPGLDPIRGIVASDFPEALACSSDWRRRIGRS
jgi:hypothetical protein